MPKVEANIPTEKPKRGACPNIEDVYEVFEAKRQNYQKANDVERAWRRVLGGTIYFVEWLVTL